MIRIPQDHAARKVSQNQDSPRPLSVSALKLLAASPPLQSWAPKDPFNMASFENKQANQPTWSIKPSVYWS